MYKQIMLPLGCLLVLSGCATRHLVYVHEADVGITVSASAEGNPAELNIGYDRESFSLVPQYTKTKVDANGAPVVGTDSKPITTQETMSLVGMHRFSAIGLNEVEFQNLFASGAAAVQVADDAGLFADVASRIQSPTMEDE